VCEQRDIPHDVEDFPGLLVHDEDVSADHHANMVRRRQRPEADLQFPGQRSHLLLKIGRQDRTALQLLRNARR